MGSKRFRGSILLCLLVGLIAALVIAGCGGGSSSSSSSTTETTEETKEPAETETERRNRGSEGIAAAPEFTSEELYEHAGDNWITNGGSTTNDRFSTLDEINTENVKELKGDWMTKIGPNATAAKFSAEGQALEYEGTIYISDGADDVFAMDAGDRRNPLDLRTAPSARPARRSRLLRLGQPRRRDRRRHGLRLAAERRPGRARPGNRQSQMVDQRSSNRARASRSPARRSTTTARSTSAAPAASTASADA